MLYFTTLLRAICCTTLFEHVVGLILSATLRSLAQVFEAPWIEEPNCLGYGPMNGLVLRRCKISDADPVDGAMFNFSSLTLERWAEQQGGGRDRLAASGVGDRACCRRARWQWHALRAVAARLEADDPGKCGEHSRLGGL